MGAIKTEVYENLKKLEIDLKETIGSNKEHIISQVKSNTIPGGEREGSFIKMFLSKPLQRIFQDNLVIEGIDSKGKTQFKQSFFGTKPAPDFVIDEPLNIVGEVKYSKLSTREVGTAIGQILLYLTSSKAETRKYNYGCIIFFNTLIKFYNLQREEYEFIKYLWENENIFLVIV